jgi:hypothetical protein
MKDNKRIDFLNGHKTKNPEAFAQMYKDIYSNNSMVNILNNIKTLPFHMGSPNKKDQKFNIRIHKNDLILLDLISEHFNVKRSEILGSLISSWTEDFFDQMIRSDQIKLANYIDRLIREDDNYHHHYQDRTWWWQLAEVYPANDPDEVSYITKKAEKE